MNKEQSSGSLRNDSAKPEASEDILHRHQRWLRLELAGLCVLMAIVWALLILPIVFYYLPVAVVSTLLISCMPCSYTIATYARMLYT